MRYHDLLTETWRNDDFCLPCYELFNRPSIKHTSKHHVKKSGSSSGGITLGFKLAIKQSIKLIASNPHFIWAKLENTFFNLNQGIFLCAIYVPPRDSPYFNPDIFDDLQTDIAKFSSEGLIMLTGDLNARTGCGLDYVDTDPCTHIPGDDSLPPLHAQRERKNCDFHVNEHGQSLLEICKACDLRILNGRTTGDSFGKTFHSPRGISTVD